MVGTVQSLGIVRVERAANRFWVFLPNCFSSQSFNIFKEKKKIKSEREKKINLRRIELLFLL